MALHLTHLSESDLPTYYSLLRDAFQDEVSTLMFPNPPSALDRDAALVRERKLLNEDKTTHYLKVTDSTTGEIIACAKWHIYEQPRSKDDWEREAKERKWPPGSNVEVKTAFFGLLVEQRIRWLSDSPGLFLNILISHPKHHRRGAGSMLLQWGADQADRLGLVSYLEASVMGQPLYERFGFEQVDDIVLDLRPYGGTEVDHHAVMLRQPRPREL